MSVTETRRPSTGVDTGFALHDPDGPYCHILDADTDEPLCGIEIRPSRLRRKHTIADCPSRGCVRCPDCADLYR